MFCEKENFDFKDSWMLRSSAGGIDYCPTSKKRRTSHHVGTLLSHDEGSRANRRVFETGSSSRAPSSPTN